MLCIASALKRIGVRWAPQNATALHSAIIYQICILSGLFLSMKLVLRVICPKPSKSKTISHYHIIKSNYIL